MTHEARFCPLAGSDIVGDTANRVYLPRRVAQRKLEHGVGVGFILIGDLDLALDRLSLCDNLLIESVPLRHLLAVRQFSWVLLQLSRSEPEQVVQVATREEVAPIEAFDIDCGRGVIKEALHQGLAVAQFLGTLLNSKLKLGIDRITFGEGDTGVVQAFGKLCK